MNISTGCFRGAVFLTSLALMSAGCWSRKPSPAPGVSGDTRAVRTRPDEAHVPNPDEPPPAKKTAPEPPGPPNPPPQPKASPAKKTAAEPLIPATAKQLGPHVYFERIAEGDQRRVYVEAAVCLREGEYGLEFLLCRKATKEHESVLHTEADARIIHLGLQAAGAVPGSPVKFDPEFKSPTGTPIKITARYTEKGKLVTRPAQDWVRNTKTKKALAEDWVFAGSEFFTDPEDPKKKPIYLATAEGSYVSVANVPTAMLDLPINSPKQLEGRTFAPFTERIPPVDTKVVLVLEPVLKDKKK